MTVLVPIPPKWPLSIVNWRRAARTAVAGSALALYGLPAQAQVAASATILNEYRFRGYSISQDRPVLEAALSYDDASGTYANASMMGVLTRRNGPGLLGAAGNIGYAKRLASGPVVDLGFVHTVYTSRFSGRRHAEYSETYLGIVTKHLSSHLYFSPNYLRRDVKTVYVDLEGVIRPAASLRVTGHVGLLTQVSGPRNADVRRSQYDVRIGAARRFGSIDVQLAWTTGGPDPDYYARRAHSKSHVIMAITYIF